MQSFHPDHYAVALAATHDFEAFAARELESREELFYPPFSRLVNLRIHGVDRDEVERVASALRGHLDAATKGREDLRVVGPAPAPLSMLRGRHRFQLLLRAATAPVARRVAVAAVEALGLRGGDDVKVEIDVDPQSLL